MQRVKEEAKGAYERQRQTESSKENLQRTYEQELQRLRQQVQDLTTEMEHLQLQQEYSDQRRSEQERARNLHHHEMLSQQERMGNKWKRELEKSAAAYEALIAKIKSENEKLLSENNHWRTQLAQAQALKQERISKMLKERALTMEGAGAAEKKTSAVV